MDNKLTLKNPITVDGKEVAEVTYDTSAITGALFTEASIRFRTAGGSKNVSTTPVMEFDYAFHLYLGYAAIIAANSTFDWSDLERIHGIDVVYVTEIGRNFILKSEQ